MTTTGIEGLYVETHNWGKTVAFWQGLGFQLQFETDHHSGQLEHPAGGPFIFLAERPADRELETYPVVAVDVAESFTTTSRDRDRRTVHTATLAAHGGLRA